MNSREKVLTYLDQAQQLEDTELADAVPLPVPPAAVRGGLAMVAMQLPEDPDELDRFLEGVSEFALSMRSDHAEP